MLEGIAAGFILSLVLFPGTVWLLKVGVVGTVWHVFVAASGFALSQLFWLMVSIPGLLMMVNHLVPLRTIMHLFATFVLFYMAFKMIRSRRVETLGDAGKLPSLPTLFQNAFNRALAMPMRLPTAMAILLATGVYANDQASWEATPAIMVGGVIGVAWWWGQFFLLTTLFVRRVPERTTIKSINKIRPFCASILGFLGIVSLVLIIS